MYVISDLDFGLSCQELPPRSRLARPTCTLTQFPSLVEAQPGSTPPSRRAVQRDAHHVQGLMTNRSPPHDLSNACISPQSPPATACLRAVPFWQRGGQGEYMVETWCT
ncbi:hypothetical protein LCI18_005645 [Fusarium solani-melongenae]|uniref:Uncharacterized protein n=1 Tax=Fusarium solani subsp. cucurbitae TaxID=2747967 RepID=A0ACD3Z0I3_FUSSC|nr:hypothetical protein LCI18_005645 [Fusarium solani-melongenae]